MIICDIDGCIFDNRHRADLIPEDKNYTPNWSEFNNACEFDLAIIPVMKFVKHLAHFVCGDEHRQISFVTSRGESAREATAGQLFPYFGGFKCTLIMRKEDDHRDTVDYKKEVFEKLSGLFTDSSVIIDDNPEIISMVKAHFPRVNPLLVPSFDCTVIDAEKKVLG